MDDGRYILTMMFVLVSKGGHSSFMNLHSVLLHIPVKKAN